MLDNQTRSGIYAGHVMHHRFRPKTHRFSYPVFSLLLDLDEVASLSANSRWFSLNRFNVFSFHEKDHGDGQGNLRHHITTLYQHSLQHCNNQQDKGDCNLGRIAVLCYPRILGYVFNPLSVYFCYDENDALKSIIYEVSNTFAERHSYIIKADASANIIRQYTHKQLYVSPFTPEISHYNFRVKAPGNSIAVCISQHQQSERLLHATFTGDRLAWQDRNLLYVFFKYPLMTLKVFSAIHWQALKLWTKGVSVNPHIKGNKYSFSWQDHSGVDHYEVL